MLFWTIENEHKRILIEMLYNNHKYSMLYTAKAILNNQQLAEDAVHQSFLKLINHLDKISDATI